MVNALNGPRRALALVSLVGKNPAGTSFKEMSMVLGIGSASLSRLLKVLLEEGWIDQDLATGHYIAGSELLGLGYEIRSHNAAPELISPVIAQLSCEVGHSACFATMQQNFFMLMAKAEIESSYHFMDTFARNYDWLDNAMGQVLLAFQPPHITNKIYQLCFHREPTGDEQDGFAHIRQSDTFTRVDGAVARVIAPVKKPDNSVDSLIAVAALDPTVAQSGKILEYVKSAAIEAERRLAVG